MNISIDPASATPPYEQVRLRIAALAADGELAAGARLPPVRQLAGDLGLAVNTVARAYRELEQAGLVDVKAGDRLQNGMRVVSVQANEVIVETAKRQRIRLLTSAGGAHSYGSGYAGATPPLPPLSPAQGIRGVMP